MNFIRLILILIVVLTLGFTVGASGQNVPNDVQKVCISQAAANACRDNALLIPALNEKIAALEAQVKARDASIAELIETNRKNVTDLKDAMHKTELQLAQKTGEIIACQANDVSNRAIITAMIPMLRAKRVGLNIF